MSVSSRDFVVSSSDSTTQQDAESKSCYANVNVVLKTGIGMILEQFWATAQGNIAFSGTCFITGVNEQLTFSHYSYYIIKP